MANLNHEALEEYLEYLQNNFEVSVCINDFVGFIPLDIELDLVLQRFMAHTNSFCMYVKSDKNLMQKCLNMKKKIFNRCLREGGWFYGVCHAGAGEFIYPITYNDQLLGIINIGMYDSISSENTQIINRMCEGSELDGEKALELFKCNMKGNHDADREKEMHSNFNFLCCYLGNCFDKLSVDYHAIKYLKRKHNSSEDFILSHCIQYIRSNYANSIDVPTLQAQCHCSESAINHMFKRRTGKGVKGYVNDIRINESKKLLSESNESISTIGSKVGFLDPDYFSRVFSKSTGIAPRLYRERFSKP